MYKYMLACLFTLFVFQTQSNKVLEDGVEELISNSINVKSVDYKNINEKGQKICIVNNSIKSVISKNKFYFQLINEKDKLVLNNKQVDLNIDLEIEDVTSFKYKKQLFYIFQFKTLKQGIRRLKFNVILSEKRKKIDVMFCKWNSSDKGITNSIGVFNKKLFVLNQIRDSISYYELFNEKFIYKPKNSVKFKLDSLQRICVPHDYKF